MPPKLPVVMLTAVEVRICYEDADTVVAMVRMTERTCVCMSEVQL